MAIWHDFKLVFLEPPKASDLKRLNKELQKEDKDTPVIHESGVEARWRGPLVSVAGLIELLVKHGLEAKFQRYEAPYDYVGMELPCNQPWYYTSDLARVKEQIRALTLTEQKALKDWLRKSPGSTKKSCQGLALGVS